MSSGPTVSELETKSEHSEFLNAVRVLRERRWLVVVCFVVGAGVAWFLGARAVKQYTATSTLLVAPSNLTALIDPTQQQSTDATTLARLQSDDVSLLASSAVASLAKQSLHTSESIGDLQDEVAGNPGASNDLIDVLATDPNATRAAAIANAFATSLVNYQNASAQAQLISGQTRLVDELKRILPSNPEAGPLSQALKQVVALQAVTSGGVQIVDLASVPSSPSSPSAKREAAIGGVVGLAIGLALAFMLELFDRRIKTTKEIERLYGMETLAMVPLRRRQAASERALLADLEPFRILRDALAYVSLRKETRVVLVTSAIPGEGKTRVASGLAQAIAAANKHVALIEVDVHRPALRRRFEIPSNGRGLMNVLVDGSSPIELMRPVPKFGPLAILPCGPFTPNSAELLRLPAMRDALADLAQAYDLVILDAPPLLPVADSQVLLDNPMIDAVIIVGRPYLTTRDQISATLSILKRHPTTGVGLVINGSHNRDGSYSYNYPGSRTDTEPPARRRIGRLVSSK